MFPPTCYQSPVQGWNLITERKSSSEHFSVKNWTWWFYETWKSPSRLSTLLIRWATFLSWTEWRGKLPHEFFSGLRGIILGKSEWHPRRVSSETLRRGKWSDWKSRLHATTLQSARDKAELTKRTERSGFPTEQRDDCDMVVDAFKSLPSCESEAALAGVDEEPEPGARLNRLSKQWSLRKQGGYDTMKLESQQIYIKVQRPTWDYPPSPLLHFG